MASAKEKGDVSIFENLNFIFKLDIPSLLKYQRIINIQAFAKYAGINQSLMHQYKNGQYMSKARKEEIINALNKLGKELMSIQD